MYENYVYSNTMILQVRQILTTHFIVNILHGWLLTKNEMKLHEI